MPVPYHAGVPNPQRFPGLRGMRRVQPNGLPAHSRRRPNLLGTARNPTSLRLPERLKAHVEQSSSGSHIALSARYVALLVDGPSGAGAITKFLENVRRLTQCPLSAWIVAANLDHIGKVVKTTRDFQPVQQHTPAREAPFKIALRRGVVTPIPRRYRQSIQRRRDARLIAQFFIKREALF